MKWYSLSAKMLAPFGIQESRQSNNAASMTYIPGTTLRGAVASHYLRSGGDAVDSDFVKLFIDQPLSFPNLYPSNERFVHSTPLPLSAISCKRRPGFVSRDESRNGHGVKDILASNAVLEHSGNFLQNKMVRVCPECGNDMFPFAGFWNRDSCNPETYDANTFFQRHTGIDRSTGTIAMSIFYVTQAVSDYYHDSATDQYKPQYMTGRCAMTDEHAEILNRVNSSTLFVGCDRSRGMGEIELQIQEIAPPEFDINRWSQEFTKKMQQLSGKDENQPIYFSIKLESHAVLMDRFLRPVADIEIQFPDIELELKIIKPVTIRGWYQAWGIPKPDDTAVTMGSIYLFSYRGNDLDGLNNYLSNLQQNGIGCRKSEGCGRISICEDFHLAEVM